MKYDRDYQVDAIDSIFSYFMEKTGNPLIAMPTGTGKGWVIARFCQKVLSQWPGERIFVMTHVQELVAQDEQEIKDAWPTAPVGVYNAGLGRKELSMPITVCSIQSVSKALVNFHAPDLFLIDEAHLVGPNANSMYRKLIAHWLTQNPFMKVVGFTATPYRMGQGMLTDDGLFTDICIDMTDLLSFNWFLDNGYLVKLIPQPTVATVDATGIHIVNGDYNKKELENETERITFGALKEAMGRAGDRRKWLVFCAGNENTEHAAEILNSFGRNATFVHDGVANGERHRRIEAFKAGEYDAITNNNILTTGFNDPGIDCIIMLRKTTSPGLWVQMLGRGTRPMWAPGYDLSTPEGRLHSIWNSPKQNCLVLDFARNTRDLGPINDPQIPHRPGKGGGEAPVKICPKCNTYNHTSVRFCTYCGEEFEFTVKFFQSAGTDELIKSEAPVYEWFDVYTTQYSPKVSKGTGLPMLMVNNLCGFKSFREYVLLEHPGRSGHDARMWWRARSNAADPPETVALALVRSGELKKPRKVRVHVNTKYPEVVSYEY